MKRSIILRLSAMFGIVSLLVFTLVGCGLFVMMERQLFAELRATIDTRAKVAAMIVSHATTAARGRLMQEKLADLEPPDGSTHYQVISDNPAFRFGSPVDGVPLDPPFGAFQRYQLNDSSYAVMTKTITLAGAGERPTLQLVVATTCERTQRMLRRFGWTLAALIATATVITLLLSRAVARFGLAPLDRLSQDAASVSATNRRQRLHTDALPTELRDLATSFNGALERIQQTYARLEAFNADVAHELRTPISILIGQTQVALTSRDRSVDRMRQTLQSNLEEFERLRVIINDMLFLSRSDRGERASDLKDVSLADEVRRMLDFLEIPLDEAQLRAELHGDARAAVDPSLFRRAMTNLLINAIQHSAPGATLNVTITRRDTLVEMAVSNPGEPIDPVQRSHVFERFYRLEEARANSKENHGLGLSIVKAVAEMHGGGVFVACSGGVNTFGFSVSTQPSPGGPLRPADAAGPAESTDSAASADPHGARPTHAPRALH
ncbi:heavy metal sensor histidine kinase [Burkholderia cenocepacia]|uniref:heavy metal sensor histidine kinase n=1 Tax=Burkholderia cenocepacia TaxID=95486 RepID=UPI001B9A3440|nr:heavy metal sensor histidine kinase [Burkholderia cenocepacia]MBR7984432.1 heavy metal sensor histidine kinase [Burkholderia cenocepacia]MBR7991781.1 heavy metal sensor histidine kinase [Burkholderia cenocepacia]MBR8037452.1 heavy metal sensor histidine kinase [Burkholderia cenocepacia]MBR8072961.1 heavy metal sensor histidine kinase [Burkholderia cenocepacia]MBR8274844.1 heavy metal sensor histidine kinase [Burkholderia cenocepacia]